MSPPKFGRLPTAAACCVLVALCATEPCFAFQLITDKEAALPLNPGPRRGITRGPAIVVVSPSPIAGLLTSPLNLKVRFESRGGSKIDVDSVVVTYEKIPAIDLTQRIKGFITPAGIDIADAEVPPGTHRIRIEVSDNDGRTGAADFAFTVTN